MSAGMQHDERRLRSFPTKGLLAIGLVASCAEPEVLDWTATDTSSTTQDGPEPTTSSATFVSSTSGVDSSESGGESASSSGSGDTSDATTEDASTSTSDSTSDEPTSDATSDATSTSAGDPLINCNKIDFLFVIDNHSGGGGSLATMAASIPTIADRISQQLQDRDVHAMVIDTDDVWGQPFCEQKCLQNGVCEGWEDYPCELELDSCDRTLGSGLVYPGVTTQPCEVVDGGRYIVGGDNSFADALSCLTDVGNHGDGIQYQAQATIEALQTDLTGDCNQGFLRDDAALVVTIVSHAPDTLSKGTPEVWANTVASVKGSLDGVVMLGILDDSELPGGLCHDPGGNGSMRLHDFVNEFPHSVMGSVCAASYVPYFDQALQQLSEVCEQVGS